MLRILVVCYALTFITGCASQQNKRWEAYYQAETAQAVAYKQQEQLALDLDANGRVKGLKIYAVQDPRPIPAPKTSYHPVWGIFGQVAQVILPQLGAATNTWVALDGAARLLKVTGGGATTYTNSQNYTLDKIADSYNPADNSNQNNPVNNSNQDNPVNNSNQGNPVNNSNQGNPATTDNSNQGNIPSAPLL